MNSHLIFLKLGGSLITDKTKPHTVHGKLISQLGHEILVAQEQDPNMQLILGHGSGSFGHVPAKKYGTRIGVSTSEEWQGFWEVWKDAHGLQALSQTSSIETFCSARELQLTDIAKKFKYRTIMIK